MSSVNNNIPFVPENTIDPAAGLNESINVIDALLQLRVIAVKQNAPPVSPSPGDRYIVGSSPTGAWAGQAMKLATWMPDGYWMFRTAWVAASGTSMYINTGSDWVPATAGEISDKITALIELDWTANTAPFFTGANTVDKFVLSAVSRGILAAGLGNAANATVNVSVQDATSDRVMRTGSGGILGRAISNTAGPAALQGGMWYDTSTAVFPAATAYLNVPGNRSFALAARNTGAWIYTYGDSTPVLLTLLTDQNSPKSSGGQAAANGNLWVQSNNGMYGVGGIAISRNSIEVANEIRASEIFVNGSTNADSPYGVLSQGLRIQSSANFSAEFAAGLSGNGRFFGRVYNGGSWKQHVEFWHNGNLTPNKLDDRTLATLPAASANLNQLFVCIDTPRGRRSVISDGTNWVKLEDNSLANAA